jgi:hypothetical protein
MRLIDDLQQVLDKLPEDRAREVLDFARFIAQAREDEEWREAGSRQFARAYGPDEPEYSEADIIKEVGP